MIQAYDAATDAASAGIIIACDERAYTRIGADDSSGGQRWSDFHALLEEDIHFFSGHAHVIHRFNGDSVAGCTDYAHCVVGHQDVGIGWLAAAVNDHVVDAVTKNKQCTTGGEHRDVHSSLLCDALSPYAGSVDYHTTMHFDVFAIALVEQFDTLDAVLVHNHALHLVVVECLGAMQAGVEQVGNSQAEGVDRRVRDANGTNQVGIHGGLDEARLLRVDNVSSDSSVFARFHKGLLVLQVVLGKGDEQAVGFLHAMAGDAPQYHVFTDAFAGTFTVGHSIARTAVHETVVAPCGTCAVVVALHEQDAQAAQCAISCGAGAGRATSNDDHIIFFLVNIACYHETEVFKVAKLIIISISIR